MIDGDVIKLSVFHTRPNSTFSVAKLHSECKEKLYTKSRDVMGFGKWLYEARKEIGLTQQELAERAEISATYISALEREEPNTRNGQPRMPSPDIVAKIAKAVKKPESEARQAAYEGLYIPPFPTKPKNYVELLEALEKLGIEINWAAINKNLENYTEDDYEDLFERIKFDTDFSVRRKAK